MALVLLVMRLQLVGAANDLAVESVLHTILNGDYDGALQAWRDVLTMDPANEQAMDGVRMASQFAAAVATGVARSVHDAFAEMQELVAEIKADLEEGARDYGSRVQTLFFPAGNTIAMPAAALEELGELAQAYALASVVFVGGSLVTRGGQNILEPAGQGKPVLFGPHMENFKDSVQVLQGRGDA